MGKLIIIEGVDGSGKQTQTEMLYKRLSLENVNVKKISFPNYESDSSILVKMYLTGKLGKNASEVNAYAASTFFSVDRYVSYKTGWQKEYEDGYVIISDRYTSANMIHQGSKILDEKERNDFLTWIEDFEFNKIQIPKPNLIFFLNMPISYAISLIKDRKNKITGKDDKDIHENDLKYLTQSYNTALNVAKSKNWSIINCINDKGEIKTIEQIHEEIYEKLKEEIL